MHLAISRGAAYAAYNYILDILSKVSEQIATDSIPP